jgi:hypothetical protein
MWIMQEVEQRRSSCRDAMDGNAESGRKFYYMELLFFDPFFRKMALSIRSL